MIQIALRTEFRLAKEVRTTGIIGAVHAGFLQARLNGPALRFTMEEGIGHRTSSIERVLRRFPEMRQFDHMISRPCGPGGQAQEARRIGNDADSPAAGAPVEISTLLEISAGIPRRYPFFSATVRVTHPAFGNEPSASTGRAFHPGLTIADQWGPSRRRIALSALAVVEADPAGNVPPTPAASVAAVLDACGQHSRPRHIVLPGQDPASTERVAVIARDLEALCPAAAGQTRRHHDNPDHRLHGIALDTPGRTGSIGDGSGASDCTAVRGRCDNAISPGNAMTKPRPATSRRDMRRAGPQPGDPAANPSRARSCP